MSRTMPGWGFNARPRDKSRYPDRSIPSGSSIANSCPAHWRRRTVRREAPERPNCSAQPQGGRGTNNDKCRLKTERRLRDFGRPDIDKNREQCIHLDTAGSGISLIRGEKKSDARRIGRRGLRREEIFYLNRS